MSVEDEKHLDLLAIFHYVVGGLAGVFSFMPFMHVFMGIAFLTGQFDDGSASPPPPFVGWMMIIMGTVFILGGWTLAILILINGRKIQKRRNRMFCMVVAGIECVMMPFGTVLGVFTLVVLCKDSVKAIFAQSA